MPGPDRERADEWEMQVGIKSRIQVCMERYGLSRDSAIEHIKQVADDEAALKAAAAPRATPPAAETMPSEEQDARKAIRRSRRRTWPDDTAGSESGYEDQKNRT